MDNLQGAYLSVYQELDEDGYKSPYQAPPAHGRSFQGNPQKGETLGNPARLSPAMRATQKSDQLRASEPGSTRERKQTTRARQLQRNFQSARTVGEETDLFDYLLEYLVAEGYADTNDAAIAIMANMSEEWKQSIVEEYKDFPTAKVMKKAGDLMGSSAGKTDEKSKKKEKRGIKMMDTMMQHSPD